MLNGLFAANKTVLRKEISELTPCQYFIKYTGVNSITNHQNKNSVRTCPAVHQTPQAGQTHQLAEATGLCVCAWFVFAKISCAYHDFQQLHQAKH